MPRLPIPEEPPAPPFRREFWKSPLRGPWLTSLLGTLLLGFIIIVASTGFLSHAAYQPDLGRNAIVPKADDLAPFIIGWPSSPSWLYAFTQGLHVTVGIVAIPMLLAKLWSVIPRLFSWPPVTSPSEAIERPAIALLVGSSLFLFATGVVNTQLYYPFRFNFVQAHYFAAWVFVAALLVHLIVKAPIIWKAIGTRNALAPLRETLADTRPEPGDSTLIPSAPADATITRRGVIGLVAAASGALATVTAGQSIGGPLRQLAFFSPRGGDLGDGPNDFPVNKTARGAGITPDLVGSEWRLVLRGGTQEISLTRDELLAMEQRTEDLPIACVEGWSTTQTWTGVPITALAALVDAVGADEVLVESVQPRGILRQATLGPGQLSNDKSLLALKVNGADLAPDHGFPARIIVPALPGVHCTKWVGQMTFKGGEPA